MEKTLEVSGAQVKKGTLVEVDGVEWEVNDLWMEMGYVSVERMKKGPLGSEYKVFENYSREKLDRMVREGRAWIF